MRTDKGQIKMWRMTIDPFEDAADDKISMSEVYNWDFNFDKHSFNQIKKII